MYFLHAKWSNENIPLHFRVNLAKFLLILTLFTLTSKVCGDTCLENHGRRKITMCWHYSYAFWFFEGINKHANIWTFLG